MVVRRQTLLGAALLISLIGLTALSMPFITPDFRVAYSYSSPTISYDSSVANPSYYRRELSRADVKSFESSMQFQSYGGNGYMDLFQTAPLNSGIRLEATGRMLALIIGAENANGYEPFLLTSNLVPREKHEVTIALGPTGNVDVWLDHKRMLATTAPDLDYLLSAITVGRGYSPNRAFRGNISNFIYSYKLYEAVDVARVRLVLVFVSICLAYLLVRGGDFSLSSTFPEVSAASLRSQERSAPHTR